MRALPQSDRGGEIADDERDRLAEIPVGWIADQSGAGVGVGGGDHPCGPSRASRETSINAGRGTPVRASPPIPGSCAFKRPAERAPPLFRRLATYIAVGGVTRMLYW